jgi:hypothetical protein
MSNFDALMRKKVGVEDLDSFSVRQLNLEWGRQAPEWIAGGVLSPFQAERS